MNPQDSSVNHPTWLAARPALWRRFAASVYDSLLLLGVLFLATAVILPYNAGNAFSANQYGYPLYLLLVTFVFFGWFWTHGGQTLGLRAWKIKVESLDGTGVSWRQAAVRFTLLLLTLGIDLLWLWVNKSYLPLHERLSDSIVVFVDKPTPAPEQSHITPPPAQ